MTYVAPNRRRGLRELHRRIGDHMRSGDEGRFVKALELIDSSPSQYRAVLFLVAWFAALCKDGPK